MVEFFGAGALNFAGETFVAWRKVEQRHFAVPFCSRYCCSAEQNMR
jgi:hypothetical protein